MKKTIIGVFINKIDAEEAIAELEVHGFNPRDMSIVMKDARTGEEIEQNTGANMAGGAVTGVTTGGVIGGLAGLLVGIGAITIPGIGGLFIAGPLASALGLTGVAATTVSGAATGALAGGIIGALMGLGIPEDQAKEYEESIREGAILLAIPATSSNQNIVYEIIESHGADQIRTISQEQDADIDEPYEKTEYKNENPTVYKPMGTLGGRSSRRKRE